MARDQTRIIVHADDVGHGIPATLDIMRCIDHGVITSISILANMPGTEHALRQATTIGDRASIGVHLNLCEGRPVTAAHSLVDADGSFRHKQSVVVRALFKRFNERELEGELTAQVARVKDAGVRISHFDSHKHLHLIPGITRVVARVARRFGVERIRCPIRSAHSRLRSRNDWLPTFARTYLAQRASHRFTAAGLRHPDRFLDLQHLFSPSHSRDARIRLVHAPSFLTEIMCHPARRLPALDTMSDLSILLSDEFPRLLHDADVALCSYWNC